MKAHPVGPPDDLIQRHGYDLVYTPHIMSEKIFEISGHLVNFKDAMFAPMDIEGANYRLGRRLTFDAKTERTGDPNADQILHGSYRKGYEVPETV